SAIEVRARPDGGGWLLDGQAFFVVDGASADLLVVAATTPGGLSLFLVESAADGLTTTPQRGLDLTRRTARLDLAGTPGRLLGTQGDGWRVLQVVRDHGAAALAAEQVGVARACLEMAVAYAKVRVQFGRPIGSFQAIKHRCADMLMQLEAAVSAAAFAAWAAAEDPTSLPEAAALAGSVCADAGIFAAEENVQVHGGIGFTWEHPAHLYVRRAHSNAVLLGTADEARDRLADQIVKLP
ncbi:MAG: acyl-CoA dehydrogenase, partial [Frankiales bacterium]|nr:acyl-CoA dehydrogenase [Frankiales bacterium]